MLSRPRGLGSNRKNASNRRHDNDSIEPEVKTATRSLWSPYTSESTAKQGIIVLAGVTDPGYQRVIRLLLHNEEK
jgi:deoxycytidine triphosphate deaminase